MLFLHLPLAEMKRIGHYLSLVKFSHTVFALPFALIGFSLGLYTTDQAFDWGILAKVILCMVFARNAAMGFNRYIDADIDLKNKRTAMREVPAGIVSKRNALVFVLINCLLFVVSAFFINTICFYLSPVALFVILFYSYTKRFTALCHLVLGAGLALAPMGAYLAVTGKFAVLPLLFSFIVFTWVSGFDILYALQDEEFDNDYHLHSIPVLMGRKAAMRTARFLHSLTAVLIIVAGFEGLFPGIYWIGAFIFIGLLFYQHSLVKYDDISKINLAFGTTNGIASVVYAVFVIASIFLSS